MQENYISIGDETAWPVAAFSIVLTVAICIVGSIRARKLTFTVVDGALIAWNGLVWVFAMPYSIWMPVLFGLVPAGALVRPQGTPALSRRAKAFLVSFVVILPAGMFVLMMNLFEHRIELTSESVQETHFNRVRQVPRQGLEVHATGSTKPGWLDNRQWWSWSLFSGDALGPELAGFEVFIGPHGLVRGDDLGRRLAQWAGTPPVYSRHDR